MILSLRDRLLVATVVLVAAGLLVADYATYSALDSFLLKRVDDQLTAAGPAAVFQLGGPGGGGPGHGGPGGGGEHPSDAGLPSGTYVALYSPGGTLIEEKSLTFSESAGGAKPLLPSTLPNAGPDRPTLFTASSAAGSHFRVMVESLDQLNDDFVVVAIPLDDVDSTLNQLVALEALVSSVVLLALAALVLLVIRASLRPLEKMGAAAAAIAAGDLTRRVEPATPRTEIGRLGLALNAMLAQIEAAFAERTRSNDRLRRFVADASHELRTPLTSIRGYAELLRRRRDLDPAEAAKAHARIEQEAVRMTALVDDLLLLARLDQGRPLEREPVDLRRIVEETAADAAVTAPDRRLQVDLDGPVVVTGDDLRLRQVVANLVRNAIVHTPAGTPVEIALGVGGERARLAVIDHGGGLDAEAREKVFEPFYRADPARSRDRGGSGLGLSIVAAVVAAHGGAVAAAQTPGGGATFSVELPIADGTASPAQ